MTQGDAYKIVKTSSPQMVRDLGKIKQLTIEAMINEIDTEFNNEQTVMHKDDWSKKRTSTPCSSPVKKKKKHEVLNFNHIFQQLHISICLLVEVIHTHNLQFIIFVLRK